MCYQDTRSFFLLSRLPLRAIATITVVFFLGLAAPAHADVVSGNITGSCCSGGVKVAGSSNSFGYQAVGVAFTPGASYTMTDAIVYVYGDHDGNDPSFDVSLFSNAGGVPGTEIASLGTDLTAPPTNPPTYLTGGGAVTIATPSITLTDGTEYWLVLTPYDGTSDIGWAVGGTTNVPAAYDNSGSTGSGWTVYGSDTLQFEIDGTPLATAPTPEPASLALFLTGILGLPAIQSVRRRAYLQRV